ncbi:MAG: hypothetical protein J6X47_09505 [Clostridia bacterium]|nr:hypothetical protein [Clostridia bacterium]
MNVFQSFFQLFLRVASRENAGRFAAVFADIPCLELYMPQNLLTFLTAGRRGNGARESASGMLFVNALRESFPPQTKKAVPQRLATPGSAFPVLVIVREPEAAANAEAPFPFPDHLPLEGL